MDQGHSLRTDSERPENVYQGVFSRATAVPRTNIDLTTRQTLFAALVKPGIFTTSLMSWSALLQLLSTRSAFNAFTWLIPSTIGQYSVEHCSRPRWRCSPQTSSPSCPTLPSDLQLATTPGDTPKHKSAKFETRRTLANLHYWRCLRNGNGRTLTVRESRRLQTAETIYHV